MSTRGPQSPQSDPNGQVSYWLPGPPSSHSPSEPNWHVLPQLVAGGGRGDGGDGGAGGLGGLGGGAGGGGA